MRDINKLMDAIKSLNVNEIFNDEIIRKTIYNNVWFTEENIAVAISEVKNLTRPEKMREIAALFSDKNEITKEIAVILSSVTPLANFKDFLYILLSGNDFLGKMSKDDQFLLKAYADALVLAMPELKSDIYFVDRPIMGFDAIILNDKENNSALNEYFARVPHLFRHRKLGLYLIKGDEKQYDLEELAYKCFVNFGLGEHSVRNIFVPKNYDFKPILNAFVKWEKIKNHPHYFNNYEYRKSICIVGNVPHIDNGFVILRKTDDMNPNVSEIFYHEYESLAEMLTFFQKNKDGDDTIRFLKNL